MLRVAAKQTTSTKCRNQLVNIVRSEATAPIQPSSSGGIGKKLLGLTLIAGAAAGGTIGYAQYDPEFRKKLEAQYHSIQQSLGSIAPFAARDDRKVWENELEDKLRRAATEHADNLERVVRAQKQMYEEEHQKLVQRQVEKERQVREMEESIGELAEQKVLEQRKNWDSELDNKLRRVATSHAENLERVVQAQKQMYEVENQKLIEREVEKERQIHAGRVDKALAQLGGIESALEDRIHLDIENRNSKQYWLACQNLIQSIVYGNKGGLDYAQRQKALGPELSAIAQACEQDQFVKTVINTFADQTQKEGVYTLQDLKTRFHKVYKLARRTAAIDGADGSLAAYASSWLQSLFTVNLRRRYSPDEPIDAENIDNHEVISRTRHFVEDGDLLSAVRVAQLLHGEPARIARDWIKDARAHLEARFLAELLLAHSAANSIRSIY